ncbi:MAG: restriction endonuclease subunit S, partial [Calditrichaeota bacterium]|nr:restriction endonuclease subunit S [Calditrichota bacterium]
MGSDDLRTLWESAGGQAPDHWKFHKIEDLLKNSKSISVGVMYPGQNSPGGIPLIRVTDVKSGSIFSKPTFCISPEVDEEYKRTRLNGTELLITLVGNPGDCV